MPALAAAQEMREPDTSKARVHAGPLAATPTLELTNLGVDTNVFNEPEGEEKKDFTFTITPRADLWLRMGRTWLTSRIREDLIWFQKYDTERTGNTNVTLGWIVPLNRLAFGAEGGYLNAKERPGYEIDRRVRRTEVSAKGSVEYRALSKTYIGARASRVRVDYDDTA